MPQGCVKVFFCDFGFSCPLETGRYSSQLELWGSGSLLYSCDMNSYSVLYIFLEVLTSFYPFFTHSKTICTKNPGVILYNAAFAQTRIRKITVSLQAEISTNFAILGNFSRRFLHMSEYCRQRAQIPISHVTNQSINCYQDLGKTHFHVEPKSIPCPVRVTVTEGEDTKLFCRAVKGTVSRDFSFFLPRC